MPPGPANTDYEGLAYLGEYPLAWAACLGNETVYNKLLDFEADPNSQDNFGNMILHMVVVCNQLVSLGCVLCCVVLYCVAELRNMRTCGSTIG